MADDGTGAEDTQVVPDAETPEAESQQTTNPEPEGQVPQAEAFDQERALATIRKLRGFEKKAAEQAKKIAEYQKAEQAQKDAELTETERLKKQLEQRDAELKHEQQSARDRQNHYEVQLQAGRLGIVDPDAAVKLLDWAALDYDDQGRPTNVQDALEQLMADRPYLAAPREQAQRPAAGGNPTNPATRTTSAGTRVYTAAEIADRAFYVANKDDIMRALREDRVTN